MDIQTVKQIMIADYLHSLGYLPVKQQGVHLWYKSPLREEHDASFKVNIERNLWYDFGACKGGNILALAKELFHSDNLRYLIEKISSQVPNIRPVVRSLPLGKNAPAFRELECRELAHPALLGYLKERGIDISLARRACKEVHFMQNGKRYFAIGFPNRAGGYEVRNSFFKGCLSPKEISHIRQPGKARETCYVFEGFMDYLSFLTIRMKNNPRCPRLDTQDYIILNSVSNLTKAESILSGYTRIGCFLDNDTAGQNTCRELKEKFGERLLDKSLYYRGYKDLNDYLCGKRREEKQPVIRPQKKGRSL